MEIIASGRGKPSGMSYTYRRFWLLAVNDYDNGKASPIGVMLTTRYDKEI